MKKPIDDIQRMKELSLKKELWKPIPFAPEYYVSNMGRIYTTLQHKIKGYELIGKKGKQYRRTNIKVNGKFKHFKIARIVAMVWVNGYDSKLVVHHKNLNSLDDRAVNLVWLTEREHRLLHQMFNAQKTVWTNRLKNYGVDVERMIYDINTEFTNAN
jgi:hypothetical protein